MRALPSLLVGTPPADAAPLVPSLIRTLYPHAYRTIGGAPITTYHLHTLRAFAPNVGSMWSAGDTLRTARPIPPHALAAADLIEDDDA